jgi:hypothetical protein
VEGVAVAKFIASYFDGGYDSMTEWPLQVPGPLRKIVYAFLLDAFKIGAYNHGTVLTPVETANENNEIQISSHTSVKIFTDVGFFNPVLFMLCELELQEYPMPPYIPP